MKADVTISSARRRQWCFPYLHDWNRWGALEVATVNTYYDDYFGGEQKFSHRAHIQWRTCERCGKHEVREVPVP